jgi:hypothetical protein
VVAAPARRRNNNTGLLIGAGAALIVIALVVATLYTFGPLGGAAPTRPVYILAITPGPTPTPTLPPTIAMTLEQLSDLKLSAHVAIESHIQVSAKANNGNSESIVVKYDGQISNGNQWGTIQAAGVTEEMRLVNGEVEVRIVPTGRWSLAAGMAPYLVICPVFGLESIQDLRLVAREVRDGHLVNHLQSTGWLAPDVSRMALAVVSGYIKPDTMLLDLWASADGTPVAASFSATNSATDGTKLLDIEVTYTFTEVGVQMEPPPRSGSSPSPKPSPSPTK